MTFLYWQRYQDLNLNFRSLDEYEIVFSPFQYFFRILKTASLPLDDSVKKFIILPPHKAFLFLAILKSLPLVNSLALLKLL